MDGGSVFPKLRFRKDVIIADKKWWIA